MVNLDGNCNGEDCENRDKVLRVNFHGFIDSVEGFCSVECMDTYDWDINE